MRRLREEDLRKFTLNVDNSAITVLSLCSGVGMLDEGVILGLEYLGLRSRVVGYAERESYAASILLARMADEALEPAPVFVGNFEDADWGRFHGSVDIIVAGFPCQPWSAAGKQAGTDDERWLWPAIVDCISKVEPAFVFLENVPGLVSGGGLEFVLSDLAAQRFDAEWCSLAASAVGASHERERIFILAQHQSRGRGILRESSERRGLVEGGSKGMGITARDGSKERRKLHREHDRQDAGGGCGRMADPELSGYARQRQHRRNRGDEPEQHCETGYKL